MGVKTPVAVTAATALKTGSTQTNISGSPPSSGQALIASSSTAATWQSIVSASDPRLTDDRTASGVRTATTTVSVSGATAPSSGQVLTATSNSAASWSGFANMTAYFTSYSTPSYASSVTLNVAASNDFVIGTLTGAISISFSNSAAGKQGVIIVKQDGSGGRSVTLNAPSTFTIVKDSNLSDLSASSSANSLTMYAYSMFTAGGSNYLQIAKSLLV